MLSSEERLMIGLKVLERIKPMLRGRQDGGPVSTQGNSYVAKDRFEQVERNEVWDVDGENQSSLQALIERAGELPSFSAILGTCEDGLPFLLDLTNPAPGSLLIAGDRGAGKTRLLQAILGSAEILNSPDQVRFHLIAQDGQDYDQIAAYEHCLDTIPAEDISMNELILSLADTAEERRHSSRWVLEEEPILILAIDDLASCLQYMDRETFTRLSWLVRHGPRSRIWTIATLDTSGALRVDERLLAAFRTRLIGRIRSSRQAAALAGQPDPGVRNLAAGEQFCVPFGEDWIRFWICDAN